MTSTLATIVLVAGIFFVVLVLAAAVAIISRLNSIDQHLEKTTILLTILANLQGATEEDMQRAIGEESDKKTAVALKKALEPESSSKTSSKKKNK